MNAKEDVVFWLIRRLLLPIMSAWLGKVSIWNIHLRSQWFSPVQCTLLLIAHKMFAFGDAISWSLVLVRLFFKYMFACLLVREFTPTGLLSTTRILDFASAKEMTIRNQVNIWLFVICIWECTFTKCEFILYSRAWHVCMHPVLFA